MMYRIFDKKNNEYVEDPDYGWSVTRNGKIYDSRNDIWHEEGERYIIEKFCGLTDKNGTRVFEGDRLRYTNHLDENGQPYYVHHIVEFSTKFNGWFAKHEHNLNGEDTQGDIQLWVYVKNIDFEVIGNIHQK